MNEMPPRTLRARTGGLWLDFKLAMRMLAKYPLLTMVGSAGIAFGLAAGVVGFEVRSQLTDPRLPLEDGRSIVGLRNWDARRNATVPLSDAEFRAWREQLRRVEDLSLANLVDRNLSVDGNIEPIAVAEMTASAFRVARVSPLLGRRLVETDESPSAPLVAVIGYSLWQRRFVGDPRVVGRTVRLGAQQATIIGVMPRGFGFPIAHEVWVPLRPQTSSSVSEPAITLVFGRLAAGVTRSEAEAELTTVARRVASDTRDTRESLRPEVVPYAHLTVDPRSFGVGLNLANLFLIMFMLVVSANVALLMFARAASRESEIGLRNALGASRGRIVAQLFVESTVLSGLSVIVGLFAARYALATLWGMFEADAGRAVPFWMNSNLTLSTIAYGIVLTMLAALITGVFPALTVTGPRLHARLRNFTAGGGGYRFGGVWTAIIVVQVAVTVLFPAWAFFFHRWVVAGQTRDLGLPAQQYLSARLVMDADALAALAATPAEFQVRMVAIVQELRRQLNAEPAVTGVTFADRLPGMPHPAVRVEVEGDAAPPTYGYSARTASIDNEFFAALDAPLLGGRDFAPTDLALRREVAIVNASFVQRVLRGQNAVGRRIRRAAEGERPPGPWIEIIGVARDLGMSGSEGIGAYRPLGRISSTMYVAVHASGGLDALADRLRALANKVEPTLRVYDVMPLDQVGADAWIESRYLSRLMAVLSGIALFLSLVTIYAIMAFTVTQRTREIGTRVALGANPWRILTAVVRRPLVQIGLGIAAGAALVALAFVAVFSTTPTPSEGGMMAAYAALMLGVCLSACVVPMIRALRLQPSRVLRAET